MSTDKKNRFREDSPVEVVDARGRTLAVMPASEAHRQSMPHRAALVLFFDPHGRLLLEKRSAGAAAFPGRWDMTARDHIGPGEASMDTARRLAEAHYPGMAGQPVFMRQAPPSNATGQEAVSIFRCRISGDPSLGGREILAVGPEELEALALDFRELLTPEVVHSLESGDIFKQTS